MLEVCRSISSRSIPSLLIRSVAAEQTSARREHWCQRGEHFFCVNLSEQESKVAKLEPQMEKKTSCAVNRPYCLYAQLICRSQTDHLDILPACCLFSCYEARKTSAVYCQCSMWYFQGTHESLRNITDHWYPIMCKGLADGLCDSVSTVSLTEYSCLVRNVTFFKAKPTATKSKMTQND